MNEPVYPREMLYPSTLENVNGMLHLHAKAAQTIAFDVEIRYQ